ncbi:M20/M25/M40 family metallo-hydrolase [Acidicapsa dinghuensis]|uniref:M20/M25/M40 family metallo-hydrolase n=1 Tax=Acidicapsa dinghuensis TaxID=2218256 RepID=A0ABW1E9F2_9BACT|nr:M20/M25/M40 family metallo-hydrolase [Acidicapsa dinghuensis]
MRLHRCAALVAAVAVLPTLFAQKTPVPLNESKGFAGLNEASLRADLRYIASDKLAGRMSLQAGDDAAIQWIADQFARAGLNPAATGPDGKSSYLQSFELIEYRPDRDESSIEISRKYPAGTWMPIEWKAPNAIGAYKQQVDIKDAPVVFAGYGITAPELGYDDYKGIDAKGKIVFVFDHEPQEDDPHSIFNGTGNTRYATTRVKLLNAQAHGAVALMVVAEPNRKHPTNAERAARIGGRSNQSPPIPSQAIADDELYIPAIVIRDEVAVQLFSTSGKTGSALQAAIDKNLKPQSMDLPETKMSIHLRNTISRRGMTSNVAGILEGSDPTLKAETILITAHHDHNGETPCPEGEGGVDEHGNATPAGPGCMYIFHGADDNGSGTVGVVNLARAFAANGLRPKRSILFVVFASEERGLLGAYWMSAHPLRPLTTTRAQINFDMIGRDEKPSPQTDGAIEIPADTTNRLNLIGALYSPDYDRVVKQENEHIGLTLDDRFDHENALNVFFRSDQFPFVLHNVPAFWWFTGFHPDYHHITDTVEKIDYAKMNRILQLAYLSAWRFADDARTPKFVENPMPAGARR